MSGPRSRRSAGTRRFGAVLVCAAALAALAAPWLGPHRPDDSFRDLLDAPPTVPHVIDDRGTWHRPFIYRWVLVDRLEQRYQQDRSTPIPIVWLAGGHLARSADESSAPLLLAGADGFGRDVFARLLFGGRVSLGVALAAAAGATVLGLLLGGIAGAAGGIVDDVLMRVSDFVLLLPAIYVALALRAVLPLVVPPLTIFLLLVGIFAVVGAPFVARGVRGIVRTERQADYVSAAISLGASFPRVLVRHVLPAARGFVAAQLTVLVPGFVVAEATLSYVGLGFPDPVASWGAMLHDASNARALADFPWLLTPAAAIFAVVLGINLLLHDAGGAGAIGARGVVHYNDPDEPVRRIRPDSDAVCGG